MANNQRKKKGVRWIVIGVVIALSIIALSFLKLDEEIVFFLTPAEALAQAPTLQEKVVRVGGMVVAGSVDWKPETLSLNFTLSDLKGVEIQVSHHGAPPDLFKEGSGVVVEGRISADGKTLLSKNLMVKHSEEYKMPEDGHSIDRTLMEQSLFKNQ